MMVVWFTDSWLIAAAISALIVEPYTVVLIPLIPAEVAGGLATATVAVWMIDVTVLLSVSSSPSKMLYIVWLAYPFCPDMLQSSNAIRHCPYALWKKVLKPVYVLLAIDSHASNSLSGNILDMTRMWTAVVII